MARSIHPRYTAAERFERRSVPRSEGRRLGTRSAQLRRALEEA